MNASEMKANVRKRQAWIQATIEKERRRKAGLVCTVLVCECCGRTAERLFNNRCADCYIG